MAYLCTRCEAGEHPNLDYGDVRSVSEDDPDQFTVVTYCQGCYSNTVHVSDGGGEH